MYFVSSELYCEVARHLADAIGAKNYFSGTLTFPFGALDCRLTVSVIVYRERVQQPDGELDRIAELVPVWWEFHTHGDEGEELNDFTFGEIVRHL